MTVSDGFRQTTVTFDALSIGDFFTEEHNPDLYEKVEPEMIDSRLITARKVRTGSGVIFQPYERVIHKQKGSTK